MKILAFGASTSSKSINQKLAAFTASLVPNSELDLLDLNDFEMPLYSSDREEASGVPAEAQAFLDRITAADGIVISFAEHNGVFSAAYKNTFDWATRLNHKLFTDKPVLLLATSPGKGGGKSVLGFASNSMPHFGAIVKGAISVPSFYENFDMQTNQLSNAEIAAELKQAAENLL
ncbi:MAG: NADPH-dependent FMN reductase [Granulosicoccaceae bacterium]